MNRARDQPRAPHPVRYVADPPQEGEGMKSRAISIIYAKRQQLLSPSWGEMREWGASAISGVSAGPHRA